MSFCLSAKKSPLNRSYFSWQKLQNKSGQFDFCACKKYTILSIPGSGANLNRAMDLACKKYGIFSVRIFVFINFCFSLM